MRVIMLDGFFFYQVAVFVQPADDAHIGEAEFFDLLFEFFMLPRVEMREVAFFNPRIRDDVQP